MLKKNLAPAPLRRDLVLIGGGHAHLGVLRAFAMRPEAGLRLTLIAKELEAPYSGMLPGYVAGAYSREECHIDLLPLATAAGARLIHGEAEGLDPEERRIRIKGRPDLGYDLLSVNVGITPKLAGVAGAAEHAIAVKPVSAFADRWEALRQAAARPGGPRRIAVVGGGAAGFELVLAAARRLRGEAEARGENSHAWSFSLIAGGGLLEGFAGRARAVARAALDAAKIVLIEEDPAVAVDSGAIRLASGAQIASQATLVAGEAEAPYWLSATGLALDDRGYLAVGPDLQSLSHPGVFAAGDCAGVKGFQRPKAGVFAVRQAMPLARNLRRAASGQAPRPFRPQERFLSLLSTADGRAIASRGDWSAEGAWVWRWKDRIDRAFMDRHRPAPMTEELEDGQMRCGGCAAKIGPLTLAGALARLGQRPEPEDAAVLDDGGPALRLETVDFFRAFWPEPWLFGRIAANHALSDVYAMGGRPRTAQAIAVLPHAAPRLQQEDLFQLTAGLRSLLEREGVSLIGGHSSEGAELAVGLAVSGAVERESVLRKGALRPGDRLILTRPIGSGVLFAAAMRGQARGRAVAAALEAMQRSHAPALEILRRHGATALTDVTGFGLAGHLLEMLEAADLAAEIDLAAIPLFAQARPLAAAGVASTLLPENLKLGGDIAGPSGAPPDSLAMTLLFDPQTAGPLLAGVPPHSAEACVSALRAEGLAEAALIGWAEASGRPGAARIRLFGAI